MKSTRFITVLASLCWLTSAVAGSTDFQAGSERIFARIDDLIISEAEFEQIFAAAVRHKYYHGRVPSEELETFRHRVRSDIVSQVLVHREALRIGLQPDGARIDAGIDAYELRNVGNLDWQARREKILPRLVERLERQDLLEQMEQRVRSLPPPSTKSIRRFYLDNPEKFTEPRQLRLSVLLLAVSPESDEQTWQQAELDAADFAARIEAGEPFAAIAARHSQHSSANVGGDLGFLHEGVLDEVVQQRIATLEPGELSEPIRVLEGVTLFRLAAVQPARLRAFEDVHQRAADLLYREQQDEAWAAFVENLRASARIVVNR